MDCEVIQRQTEQVFDAELLNNTMNSSIDISSGNKFRKNVAQQKTYATLLRELCRVAIPNKKKKLRYFQVGENAFCAWNRFSLFLTAQEQRVAILDTEVAGSRESHFALDPATVPIPATRD